MTGDTLVTRLLKFTRPCPRVAKAKARRAVKSIPRWIVATAFMLQIQYSSPHVFFLQRSSHAPTPNIISLSDDGSGTQSCGVSIEKAIDCKPIKLGTLESLGPVVVLTITGLDHAALINPAL